MRQEVTILTPEKVELSFRLAGLASRTAAALLDLGIWFLGFFAAMLGWAWLCARLSAPVNLADTGFNVILYCGVVGFLLYFILLTWLKRGQTLGKRMVGLRVIGQNGGSVSLPSAVLRTLLMVADAFPVLLLVDVVLLFLSPRCQRLGDMVAGTLVVIARTPQKVAGEAMPPKEWNPFLDCVHSVSQLDERDLQAIRALLNRYPDLDSKVRDRLRAEIWESVSSRAETQFPPDVTILQRLQAIAAKLERDLERR